MPITNYKERAIGIIKSLQPYISLENQTQINRILYVNKTLEKLIDSIKKFKEHDLIRIQDSTAPSISRAMEILDILKILVPAEQLQYIDQISSVLKLLGTIELAQLSTSAIQGTGSITDGSKLRMRRSNTIPFMIQVKARILGKRGLVSPQTYPRP